MAASDGTNTTPGVDATPTQAFADITDWTAFDNPFRAWGLGSAGFPDVGARGACTSGSCRIWDWRLLQPPTGSAWEAEPFVANGPCPQAVRGDVTTSTSFSTHLRNAIEVLFDHIGNDNGLCESDEACIYAPNVGAYQGEGDYREQSCVFEAADFVNVTMYNYPTRTP
jgi:hypothetical protein